MERNKEYRALKAEIFSGIEEEDISSLLHCLGVIQKTYKKGEIILAEGKFTENIGLVLEGMAMVSCGDVWGNQSILGHVEPGEVFAEAYACIPKEPLLICVTAAVDTVVLFLNVGRVLSVCNSACEFHTKLIRNLLTVCANKNLQLSRRILHTSPKSIRGRLLSFFSENVKKTGSYSFEIPYSRQQLADYLSVDRSALCNELSKMRREGMLTYHKRSFQLRQGIKKIL